MRRFHVRRIVEAADESVGCNIDGAFDVAVAPQREVGQPTRARRHAKLHSERGRGHRQIEGVLKLDLLRLRQAERAGDVGKRLARERDRAGTHAPDRAHERHVLDGAREPIQLAAILFEKAYARSINLTIDQQPHESFMPQAWRERQLPLRHIKGGLGRAQTSVVQPRRILVRRVAHRGVIAINVQCAHRK